MAVTTLHGQDELQASVGSRLGHSEWLTVSAERVEAFRHATGDPSTTADGMIPAMLVLSLTNCFLPEIVAVRGFGSGVNYGTGPVRFPAPAPVGSRLRGSAELVAVDAVAGGVQTLITISVQVEHRHGPACVVDSLSRWLR